MFEFEEDIVVKPKVRCKNHRKPDGYIPREHLYCKNLIKKGFKQRKCKKCGFYSIWRKRNAKIRMEVKKSASCIDKYGE